MSRYDEFDRMVSAIERDGGDVEKARSLADACRTACSSLRYTKAERETVAITIQQIGVSGRISVEEFRTLRESAPFLSVSAEPFGIDAKPEYMTAIATACGSRPSVRSAISNLVRVAADQLKAGSIK